ncbi:MAG: DUF3089 domain-containing protein [Actinomycetota bacterium]
MRRLATVLIALALVAAACGDDESNADDVQPSTTSTATVPADDPAEAPDGDEVADDADLGDTETDAVEPVDADPDGANPYAGYVTEVYDDPAVWLCWPGNDDVCARDNDATIIHPDGTLEIEPFVPAADPVLDCFYVYPTISADETANSDLIPVEVEEIYTAWMQAARYGEACRVFAPVYRQNTLTSMFGRVDPPEGVDTREIAYADVLDAFSHYMATVNDGRGVVLLGHSQGAGMISRLIAEEIDGVDALMPQFVGAHILGSSVTGDVSATFEEIGACTEVGEIGCVVSYASYEERTPVTDADFFGIASDDRPALCTNPADLSGAKALSQPYFLFSDPRGLLGNSVVPPLDEATMAQVTTDWISLPGMVTTECIDNGTQGYLSVGVEQEDGDVRADDIGGRFNPGWGLHVVDSNVALGDLVDLVAAQAEAYAG